jgi:DNA-binding MarR family transcriptional regulator
MMSVPIIGTLTNVARRTPDPAAPDNVLALDDQVCFALAVATRSVVALYKPLLEPLGLTHPQYLVMLALWECEELSVRDLSALLQLDPGTLSPLLKRLEAAGYVRRARNPHDERALAIVLTPEGRALRTRALEVPPAVVARLGLPLSELSDLQRRLTRVIAAATAEPAP